MADFQSDFNDATNTIDNLVNTQLSEVPRWNNVTGNLVKASSSAAGYVWGLNQQNDVFRCQLPCTGKWEKIDMSQYVTGGIHDLTTDNSNIYLLTYDKDGTTHLVSSPANGSQWVKINIPFKANFIFSTHTYIWAQDSRNNKKKCGKPCTTGAWLNESDKKIKITSSSDQYLYGIDMNGKAVKSDETLQTGWTPIKGLDKLNLSAIMGQMDTAALYSVDEKANMFRCTGDCSNVEQVDLEGYKPLNVSPDPVTKDVWLTAQTTGPKGNIFTRIDGVNYSSIMNKITPLQDTRDAIVGEVSKDYQTQTQVMLANKSVSDFVDYFKKIFQIGDPKKSPKHAKDSIGQLEHQILNEKLQLDQMTSTQPYIEILLYTCLSVTLLYTFGSFLGFVVHILALVILLGGLLYAINFSQSSNNDGSSSTDL